LTTKARSWQTQEPNEVMNQIANCLTKQSSDIPNDWPNKQLNPYQTEKLTTDKIMTLRSISESHSPWHESIQSTSLRHTADRSIAVDRPFMDHLSPGTMVVIPGTISNKFWKIKRSVCLVKQISLLEIISAAVLLTAVVVDLSRVFHAIDSCCTSSCPQAHTCSLWNASCTSCASNTNTLQETRKTLTNSPKNCEQNTWLAKSQNVNWCVCTLTSSQWNN